MGNRYLCLLVLIGIPCSIWASCPNVQTMRNFEAQKFMGKWYEIQKYPTIFEAGQKCVTANYDLNPNGTVNVNNRAIMNEKPITITGIATPDANDPAKLTVYFPQVGQTGKLWVIDTYYSKYALLYSCLTEPFSIENAWIMSRSRTLDIQTVDSLKSILAAANSTISLFTATDQSDCDN